jgi:hypothetical protein
MAWTSSPQHILWGLLTSAAPPIGALAANLTEEQKSCGAAALDLILRRRSGSGPIVLNMQVHIGIGTK